MKTFCSIVGIFVGMFLAIIVGEYVPILSIVILFGGGYLGGRVGEYIENSRWEREAAERQRERERVEREREEQRKREEEAQRQHQYRLQNDYLYRRQYEQRIEEERRRREEQERRVAENKRKAEEEARRKEQERRQALCARFKYISLGGYDAAYRYDYYPVNRYPSGSLPLADESARRSVWNFKDGMSSIGVGVVSDFIDGNYTREQMKNVALCVIPASTQAKNIRRYKSMCDAVAAKLPIQNGFNYITVCFDREDSRTVGKSSDTTSNLYFSSDVYGKDIILFDDITTRGTSFIQAAAELKKRGARSVRGLFLGKTV